MRAVPPGFDAGKFIGLNETNKATCTWVTSNPFISALLFASSPAAVAGFVVAVVVDAVDAVMRCRSAAHVFEEVLEGVQPAIAYRDAAAAVILPTDVLGISAALGHSSPSLIFGSPKSALCLSVLKAHRKMSAFPFLSLQATTTARPAAFQIATEGILRASTVANTEPTRITVPTSNGRLLNNQEPTEALTNKVNLRGHREPNLSGDMRTAGLTARPLNYTPSKVAA